MRSKRHRITFLPRYTTKTIQTRKSKGKARQFSICKKESISGIRILTYRSQSSKVIIP